MPEETFTPDEQQTINQIADQINVTMRTQGGSVALTIAMPAYPQALTPPPIPTQQAYGQATASTVDEALEAAEANANNQIDNVERQFDEWLTTLTAYRRQIRLYREALKKATATLEVEPGG